MHKHFHHHHVDVSVSVTTVLRRKRNRYYSDTTVIQSVTAILSEAQHHAAEAELAWVQLGLSNQEQATFPTLTLTVTLNFPVSLTLSPTLV